MVPPYTPAARGGPAPDEHWPGVTDPAPGDAAAAAPRRRAPAALPVSWQHCGSEAALLQVPGGGGGTPGPGGRAGAVPAPAAPAVPGLPGRWSVQCLDLLEGHRAAMSHPAQPQAQGLLRESENDKSKNSTNAKQERQKKWCQWKATHKLALP
jgi:hypothetical protein